MLIEIKRLSIWIIKLHQFYNKEERVDKESTSPEICIYTESKHLSLINYIENPLNYRSLSNIVLK